MIMLARKQEKPRCQMISGVRVTAAAYEFIGLSIETNQSLDELFSGPDHAAFTEGICGITGQADSCDLCIGCRAEARKRIEGDLRV